MKTAPAIPAAALLAAALVFSAAAAAPADDIASPGDIPPAFREALLAEEAEQDLPAAIAGYEDVLRSYDNIRRIAASAVFRLGECYRKQGKDDEAVAQYRRLLEDFPSESSLVKLSRENLATLGQEVKGEPSGPGPSTLNVEGAGLAEIKKILTDAPDLLNDTSGSRIPPLFSAVWDGHLEKAEYLLKEGADPNVRPGRTESGRPRELDVKGGVISMLDPGTPLSTAVDKGNIPMIELLLAHGADIDLAAKEDGATAVNRAIEKEYVDTLKALLNHDPDLSKKAKLKVTDRIYKIGNWTYTDREVWAQALHHACMKGNPEIVRLLLKAGADPQAVAEHELAPILLAIASENQAGRAEIAKNLAANGADLAAADKNGRTALLLAVQDLDPSLINYLLEQGVDPNAADAIKNLTPLDLVLATPAPENLPPGETEKRRREIAEDLIAHGADVGKAGPSVLSHAISRFDSKMLSYFLEHGGDPNAVDDGTKHSLLFDTLRMRKPVELSDSVAMSRRLEMLKILIADGADVNAETGQSGIAGSALGVALLESGLEGGEDIDPAAWEPIIDLLLEEGAHADLVLRNDNLRRLLRDQRRTLYDRLRNLANTLEIGNERADTIWADHDYHDHTERLQKVIARRTPSESPPRFAEFVLRCFLPSIPDTKRIGSPDLEKIVILRRTGDGKPDEVIEIDYAEIVAADSPEDDFQLRWGDIVTFKEGYRDSRRNWVGHLPDAEAAYVARSAVIPITVQLGDAPPRAVSVRPFEDDSIESPTGFAYVPSIVAPGDFYSTYDGNYWSLFGSAGWFGRADLDYEKARVIRAGGDEIAIEFSRETWRSSPRVVEGDTVFIPAVAAEEEKSIERRRNGICIARPEDDFVFLKFSREDHPRQPRLLDAIAHSYANARFILPYPDFSKVVLRRLEEKDGELVEKRIRVDLAKAAAEPLAAPDDTSNPQLEWGDIIEIPQLPDTDPAQWTGLDGGVRRFLDAKTRIKVTLFPEGHDPREIEIGHRFLEFRRTDFGWCHNYEDQFVLELNRENDAGPYLSTVISDQLSDKDWDLTSVIVKRPPALRGGQPAQDATESHRIDLTKRDNLLLHGGDRIEVRKQL